MVSMSFDREQRIQRLEDNRVIQIAKAIGPNGIEVTRKHSFELMAETMRMFEQGKLDQAMAMAVRELDFNRTAFGNHHPYTKAAEAVVVGMKIRKSRGHKAQQDIDAWHRPAVTDVHNSQSDRHRKSDSANEQQAIALGRTSPWQTVSNKILKSQAA